MGPVGFCELGWAVGGAMLEPALDDWVSVPSTTFLMGTNHLALGGAACEFSPSRFCFRFDTRPPSPTELYWMLAQVTELLTEPSNPK